MSWIRRLSRSDKDDSFPTFPKRSVRQVVGFGPSYWPNEVRTAAVHLETDEGNELHLLLNDEWYKHEVEHRSHGDSIMEILLGGPEQLKTVGLLTPESDVSNYVLSFTAGFGAASYTTEEADTLHLGLELAEKVSAGWLPENSDDIDDLYLFFSDVPLWVGYFAPYKSVLKTLTSRYSEHLPNMDVDFASRFAGALGRGFSVVEARLAKGKLTPRDTIGSQILAISTLPALNGFRQPSNATLQYLSRTGLRFLKFLESMEDSLPATRFRVNFLMGPQLNLAYTSEYVRMGRVYPPGEDNSLSYQQILSHIFFPNSPLARKDRDARKVILGPRTKRHSFEFDKEYFDALSSLSKDIYIKWIADGDFSKCAPIARHALAVSRGIPGAEMPWTKELAKLLISTESKLVQSEILAVCAEHPEWKSLVTADTLIQMLDWVDEDWLEMLFGRLYVYSPYYYSGDPSLNDWVELRLTKPLSKRDTRIAHEILKGKFSQKTRAALLFHLLKSSKRPPISAMSEYEPFRFNAPHSADLLGFFGVAKHGDYPIGVTDVVNFEDEELIKFFAGILTDHLVTLVDPSWYLITALADSKSEISAQLLEIIFMDEKLATLRPALLEAMSKSKPTGNSILNILSKSLADDRIALTVQVLAVLGEELYASFWRRNAKEVEQMLSKSVAFKRHYWTNIDLLPLSIRERIDSYAGFGADVIAYLNPNSMARINSSQEALLLKVAKKNPESIQEDSIIRAMLVAPSLPVHKLATDYVTKSGAISSHWLLMLESNLPTPQSAALSYLESQLDKPGFPEKLLMALDSNNQQARTLAIRVLGAVKTPDSLKQILTALVENRNSDTWNIVSANLQMLQDSGKTQEFTKRVFLSKRMARAVKEKVKSDLDLFIGEIETAVEKDTLIRLSLSSVARDREWALKQIAMNHLEISGVTVEKSWKSGSNV
jgi:hypothetical protein